MTPLVCALNLGVSGLLAGSPNHNGLAESLSCRVLHLLLLWGVIACAILGDGHLLSECFRAACLQNETDPEKCLNRYEERFEKREKRIRKTIRNAFEKFLAPLRPLKNISPALFNKF